MNNQEAFNNMYRHAQTMPRLAEENGRCMYRTKDGNRCLVGVLIPDDLYEQSMDEGGEGEIQHILHSYIFAQEHLSDITLSLLIDAQKAHDDEAHLFNEDWRELLLKRLQGIADKYNLWVPTDGGCDDE